MKLIIAWYDFWIGFFWDSKKRRLYFFPVPCLGVAIHIWGRRCYVVRKHGLFYRPDDAGYTSQIEEAGRYTLAEAKAREYRHDDPVSYAHLREFIK